MPGGDRRTPDAVSGSPGGPRRVGAASLALFSTLGLASQGRRSLAVPGGPRQSPHWDTAKPRAGTRFCHRRAAPCPPLSSRPSGLGAAPLSLCAGLGRLDPLPAGRPPAWAPGTAQVFALGSVWSGLAGAPHSPCLLPSLPTGSSPAIPLGLGWAGGAQLLRGEGSGLGVVVTS